MRPKVNPAPLLEISFDREMIDVTTLGGERAPDQKWRHTDSSGHLHAWDGDELPSLEYVVTGTTWVGDEYDATEYEVGEHRCRTCGEVVEPKYVVDHSPKYVAGPTTYTVTIGGERFVLRDDQYVHALEQWAEILRGLA